MFFRLLKAELKKIFKQTILAAMLTVLALMAVVACLASINTPDPSVPTPVWGEVVSVMLGVAGSVVGLLLAVTFAGLNLGADYQRRWVQQWVSHGAPRRSLILSKLLALLLCLMLYPLVMLVVGVPLSAILLNDHGFPVSMNLIQWDVLLACYLLTVLCLLPYGLIGTLLAVVGRSPSLPLAAGLGWVIADFIGVQGLNGLPDPWHTIATWLPSNLTQNVLHLTSQIANPPLDNLFYINPPVDPALAAVLLAALCLVLGGLVVYLFEHQNLN